MAEFLKENKRSNWQVSCKDVACLYEITSAIPNIR